MPSKWGIWCIPTETWVYDKDYMKPCLYDSERAGKADLRTFVLRAQLKDYDVRPYKEN